MKKEYQIFDEKMQKTIGVMEKEFSAIRAGRANPAVLDHITVDYYGVPTPVSYTHLDVYKRQIPTSSV